MKDFFTKIVSIILIFCLFFPISACSNEPADNTVSETTAPVTAAPVEDDPLAARRAISDDLPDVNMDGYVMKAYSNDEAFTAMFYAEEEIGEPVNDAFYYARRDISERFNAEFEVIEGGLDPYAHISSITAMVNSAETTYTLATGHSHLLGPLTLENNFLNINLLPHLNYDKPWWFDVERYSFLDQCYFVPSDMSTTSLSEAWVLYGNKNRMTDYGIEVPYQAVIDGKWTIDMLASMTKDIYEDLNGNNQPDEEDFYGFVNESQVYFWAESFGIDFYSKTEDNSLSIDLDVDKMSSIAEKMYGFLMDSKGGRIDANGTMLTDFSSEKSLFIHSYLGKAESNIRHITGFDYAILPMPKWDENQENYRTSTLSSPYCILTTLPEEYYVNTGILIEAFSAEGYKQVFPAYFEIALKQKYTIDNESMQMIDIISESRVSNFSWTYDNITGFILCLSDLFQKDDYNFVSHYEKNYKRASKQAEKVQEAFEKMAETNVW